MTGVVCFIIFLFTSSVMRKRVSKIEKIDGEPVILAGPANLMGRIARGGYLFLTRSKLKFTTHKLEPSRRKIDIPLTSISKYEITKSKLGQKLLMVSTDKKKFKFLVYNIDEWFSRINELMESRGKESFGDVPNTD